MLTRLPAVVAVATWVLVMAGCLVVWSGYTVARDPGDPLVFAIVAGVVAVVAYGLTVGALAVARRIRA